MSFEGIQLGRYQLHQLLGSGGMGEVYLAEDSRIHRQVAIKVVRGELSSHLDVESEEKAVQLFEREMKVISQLDHPHILPLYDYGEVEVGGTSITYMVLPYRPEGSLLNWLRQRKHSGLLASQDVAIFIEQAASALHHAHERRVIHQDVKPSNFLIRMRPQAPNHPDLLLTDFGISRFTAITASHSQTIRGTPTYMAPEQWEGHPTYASDQYALAVMAYGLLVGRPPFEGQPGTIMFKHITAAPPAPSSLNQALSPAIDAVLLRALAKQPEARFPSVVAFADALQQACLNKQPARVDREQSDLARGEEQTGNELQEVHAHSTSSKEADKLSVSAKSGMIARSLALWHNSSAFKTLVIALVLMLVGSSGFLYYFIGARSAPATNVPLSHHTIMTPPQVNNSESTVQNHPAATATPTVMPVATTVPTPGPSPTPLSTLPGVISQMNCMFNGNPAPGNVANNLFAVHSLDAGWLCYAGPGTKSASLTNVDEFCTGTYIGTVKYDYDANDFTVLNGPHQHTCYSSTQLLGSRMTVNQITIGTVQTIAALPKPGGNFHSQPSCTTATRYPPGNPQNPYFDIFSTNAGNPQWICFADGGSANVYITNVTQFCTGNNLATLIEYTNDGSIQVYGNKKFTCYMIPKQAGVASMVVNFTSIP